MVVRADLAYPEARLAIEYDGEVHFDVENSQRDRQRDLLLVRLDWHTMRFIADDVYRTPRATVHAVRTRRAARLTHFA